MSTLINQAAQECHVTPEWVTNVINLGSSRVKTLKIPKKSSPNQYRVIHRPSAELETLQRWLTLKIFSKLPTHACAMAFVKKKSILTNAETHHKSKYFIRIDFKDFFNSIKLEDLILAIKNTKTNHLFDAQSADNINFIRKICFDAQGRLPIGYISSPAISNAVMHEFDTKLYAAVSQEPEKFGTGVVTRYADDIIFSTNKKGGCRNFENLLKKLIRETTNPKLKINNSKTSYTSRPAGSAIVTGLRVCQDGHITITRKYKDEIRLMLSLYTKGVLAKEEIPSLEGHLSYIKYVAPAFFSNLFIKHLEATT